MSKLRNTLPVKRSSRQEEPSGSEEDAMLMDGIEDDFDFKTAQTFLSNDLQSKYKNGKEAKKSRKEEMADFERTARKWSEQVENDAGHLMIRDSNGKWRAPVIQSTPKEPEVEPEQPEPEESIETPRTIVEWSKELSDLAKSITDNPEVEYKKLKRLVEYYKCKDEKRRMIGMAATVAIFRDILPSYSIRELSDAEKAVKLSKEVQAQRDYEQTLLSSYTDFVNFCKSEFGKKSDLLPFKSLAELCKSASCRSFNCFESVLSVVACAAAVNRNDKVRAVAYKALKTLFADSDDVNGRLTMLAVKSIAGSLRDAQYKVLDKALFVALESVRLRSKESINVKPDINDNPASKKMQSHLSKKERKDQKLEKKEARKGAIEAATEAQKQQQKWARETREYLFAILFGYLKSVDKQTADAVLLPNCMSAISTFANYLGIEYFTDLTNTIKTVCEKHCKSGNLELSLHCISAVLRLSASQEAVASLDLKFFYDLYYRSLRTDLNAMAEHQGLVSQVFELLFKTNRILPRDRVASFAHRLCSAIENGNCKPEFKRVLALQLAELFTHYPLIMPLIDSEPLMIGSFLSSCDNPDICRPFCQPINQKPLLEYAELKKILMQKP